MKSPSQIPYLLSEAEHIASKSAPDLRDVEPLHSGQPMIWPSVRVGNKQIATERRRVMHPEVEDELNVCLQGS